MSVGGKIQRDYFVVS